MKVAFLFGGIPHYYALLLNRMNSKPGLTIQVYYPENDKSESIGKSVFQDKSLCQFETFGLKEKIGFLGKPRIIGLKKALEKNTPEILIVVWPYSLHLFADISFLSFLRKRNIKIVEKSIPYQIPKLKDAYKYYRDIENILDESLKPIGKKGLFTDIKYCFLTWFRKFQFRRADGHVCYVPEAKDIIGSYGVSKEKIHIILNSPITKNFVLASESARNEANILDPNPFRIVHLGRLVQWKKVHLLIEALKVLTETFPKIELLVIGDGPEKENLENQAKELGLEKSILFTGSIYDPEKIAQYMKASSVYVLAGTGGLSINDAMCFGKPIICSECDGTEKFLVRDRINGLYFEKDNVLSLVNKISILLLNQRLISEMGKESLRIIKEEVNEDVVIENYLVAFEKIVESKK